MTNNTITIEAGDIVDFTFKIQQAILDGYRLSDQGDFAPQCIGFVYVTTMEKGEYNPMPVGELSLAIAVDAEQAIKDFQTIADAAVKYNIDDETISPSDLEKHVSVGPKPTRQTRGRK